MKSNYKLNYVEMPLKLFVNRFPDFVQMLPPALDLNDDKYIVRIKDGVIEFGYLEDDWLNE